jgi:hypothetical protein
MIFNYDKCTSPSGITISIGETLCYPTYNGFEHKEAIVTHIVKCVRDDCYYLCMSNGEIIDDTRAIASKFNSLSEDEREAICATWK